MTMRYTNPRLLYFTLQTLCGVNKCEKVPEDVVRSFTKAEDKKIAEKSDANRK